MDFGAKVTKRLEDMGRSQADLAGAIGTTQQQVSRWVTGDKPPSSRYLLPMARYLGVSADYLVDSKMEEPSGSPAALTEDERTVLALVRALDLPLDEALRRLAGPRSSTSEPASSSPGRLKRG